MKKIITHNGQFHTDDVFAVATLLLLLNDDAEVMRTRDERVIEEGDYVVDVGDVYNPSQNRFDHHQRGGAGIRENNIPYAAFGLVWKEFGEKLCGSKAVFNQFEKNIVLYIDGTDNGVDMIKSNYEDVPPYTINRYLNSKSPTWKEEADFDQSFMECVQIAKNIIKREVKIIEDDIEAINIIKDIYKKSENRELVVIDGYKNFERLQVVNALIDFPEVIYAVFYKKDNDYWQVVALNKERGTFKLRKGLPEDWRGKRDKELAQTTQVPDAIFCHNSGFMCLAKTKESAIKLAKLALEA